jgi:serine/threonine-protein kinase PpkA
MSLPEIPGYRITRLIGRGGMACVYGAIEADLDREVAIKIVTLNAQRDADVLTRLEFEARSLARLRHPQIVELYRFGRIGADTLFYAMPLLSGGDLSQWLRPAPEAKVRQLLEDMLDALGYAHHHGVVHRDVKPENILFDAHARAQLADFGAAFALAPARSANRLTQEGFSVGSLGYMSPEQARGQSVSGASDLYSLAVVAFELLSDARCHEGEDAVAIALAQLEKPPAAMPSHLTHWNSFFARALQPTPALRFADASAMKAALPAPVERASADAIESAAEAPSAIENRANQSTRLTTAATPVRTVSQPTRILPVAPAARRWRRYAVLVLVLSLAGALAALQRHRTTSQAQLQAFRGQLQLASAEQILPLLQGAQLGAEQTQSLASEQLQRLAQRFATLSESNDIAAIAAELGAINALRQRLALTSPPALERATTALARRVEETLKLCVEAFDHATAQTWMPLARLLAASPGQGALSPLVARASAIPALGGEFFDERFAQLAPDLRWRLVAVPDGKSDGLAVMAQPLSEATFARFVQATGAKPAACKSAAIGHEPRGCVDLKLAQALALWLKRAAPIGQLSVPDSGQWQRVKALAPKLDGRFAISEECNQVTYTQRPNVAVRAWGGIKSVFGGDKARDKRSTFCSGARVFALDGSGATAAAASDRVLLVLVRSLR